MRSWKKLFNADVSLTSIISQTFNAAPNSSPEATRLGSISRKWIEREQKVILLFSLFLKILKLGVGHLGLIEFSRFKIKLHLEQNNI